MIESKRQKEIIDISMAIVAEEGIQNLSIRKIAKAVGIKESSIYNHFLCKDEIIDTLLDVLMSDATKLWEEIQNTTDKPMEKLELFFKKTCESHIKQPNSSKVFWFCTHQFKGQHFDKVKEIFEIHRKNMHLNIEECRKEGTIKSEFKNEYLSSLISGQAYIFLFRNLCTIEYDKQSIDELWKVIEKALIAI